MEYIAFDLEIAKIVPEGTENWDEYRPYGISCAATMIGDEIRLWHGNKGARIADYMSVAQCQELADYLYGEWARGTQIVTWNGLGFDFDVLAEECQSVGWHDNLVDVALGHIDVAFAMFCDLGYMCSMDRAAQGMKIPGKMEGMSGGLAPTMWAGSPEDQATVLEYVAQDVRVTADLYEAIITTGYLQWVTKKDRMCKRPWYPRWPLPTVVESLERPVPNTSWMENPWERSKFYGWTEE